jgi:GT2 family glycosyltransferase
MEEHNKLQDPNLLFSVIIPTYNRHNDLKKCLDCLEHGKQVMLSVFNDNERASYQPCYEVIVSDDGDADKTIRILGEEYSWVKIIQGPQKGPAANRNNGAKMAAGQWLIFTDDDCLPDQKWLSEYYKAIQEHPESKAFEGKIEALGDMNIPLAECPINLNGGYFWSANIMINKELFHNIEGFDENFDFAAFEDTDIYVRILKATHVPFCENSLIIHPVKLSTLSARLRKQFSLTYSWSYYCSKHVKINFTLIKNVIFSLYLYHIKNIAKLLFQLRLQELLLCIVKFTFQITVFPVCFILNKINIRNA